MRLNLIIISALTFFAAAAPARAQERSYFVTYDHYLEEVGNLEVATSATIGRPREGGRSYFAPWLELEYGVKGWWTIELYLEGVSVRGRSEEHTSELQSRPHLVCRLLLEKK